MPRKSYSHAQKVGGKKKPTLQWRVESATPATLIEVLQSLTDEKWRIFAVNTLTPDSLLVSAYLSSWGAADAAEPENEA